MYIKNAKKYRIMSVKLLPDTSGIAKVTFRYYLQQHCFAEKQHRHAGITTNA